MAQPGDMTLDDSERTPAAVSEHGAIEVRPPTSSFLDHLVRQNILSERAAAKVSQQRQEGSRGNRRRLVEILEEESGIPREVLYRQIAQFYSFRIVSLSDRNARRLTTKAINALMAALPEPIHQTAMKFKVLPFESPDGQQDRLLVVTPNPSDREAYEVARSFPFKRFEICYMSETDVEELWRQVTLDRQMSVGTGAELEGMLEDDPADIDSVLEREINRGQLVSVIQNTLTDAVRVGASDIHVVPRGRRKTEICFRIDGRLSVWYTIEDARSEAVVAVVKDLGVNLDRFERLTAQDGASQKTVDGRTIRFRLSILPVVSREMQGKFESVVIRILKEADADVSLETIGFDPYSLRVFREAIALPHGMVVLTGPTGSGKSTTLVAALRMVMQPSLNTITVEDPVEYLLDGARQVKINPKLDFDNALRAILRHDPDIVMVGEIRDRVTADIAIKLANTGHLTFSTLHTNDAPSAVSRLFKIGVEPFLIAQALNIVVAQRLVRKLCDRCKEPVQHPASEQTLLRAGFTPQDLASARFFRARGCINCLGGFKGRTAIHESLLVTPGVRSIIFDCGERIDTEAIRASALRDGMQTLRRSGLALVAHGVTTLEEVINTTAA
ncbi:MAG: GspE/PulE family protein [Bacteroidota bacterium]